MSIDAWAWTNDEHTQARKGRWVAETREGDPWSLEHDDFPESYVSDDTWANPDGWARWARLMFLEFVDWKARQS